MLISSYNYCYILHWFVYKKKFLYLISENFQIEKDEENMKDIDEKLNARLKGQKDIRGFIEKYDEIIQSTCKATLKDTTLVITEGEAV